jgi:hypothetical protein
MKFRGMPFLKNILRYRKMCYMSLNIQELTYGGKQL